MYMNNKSKNRKKSFIHTVNNHFCSEGGEYLTCRIFPIIVHERLLDQTTWFFRQAATSDLDADGTIESRHVLYIIQ